MSTRPRAQGLTPRDERGDRAKPLTGRFPRTQQHNEQGQPPCPCCSEPAPTIKVVKHGERCSCCSYVVWERDE